MGPEGSIWVLRDPYGSRGILIVPETFVYVLRDPYRSRRIHISPEGSF